jgi:hypothetical protein
MNLPSQDEWASMSICHPTPALTTKQTTDLHRDIHQHYRKHRNKLPNL